MKNSKKRESNSNETPKLFEKNKENRENSKKNGEILTKNEEKGEKLKKNEENGGKLNTISLWQSSKKTRKTFFLFNFFFKFSLKGILICVNWL